MGNFEKIGSIFEQEILPKDTKNAFKQIAKTTQKPQCPQIA